MKTQTSDDYVQVAQQAFSYTGQARDYFLYRPTYPTSFFTDKIQKISAEAYAAESKRVESGEKRRKIIAIDFGCGSGQATGSFFQYFDKVIGVDVNKLQLDQAIHRYSAEIESGKVEFWEADCSKIDEVIAERLKDDVCLALISVCQAFHWFDERDILKRCKKALAPYKGCMAILGYKLLEMVDSTKYDKRLFEDFYNTIRVFFAFDCDQLDNMYKDKHFGEYFAQVTFYQESTVYNDCSVQKLLGYFNTLSAYRTKLEKIDKSPEDDSLKKLVDQLGLTGYRRGDPSEVQVPKDKVGEVTFIVPFFMYVMHD